MPVVFAGHGSPMNAMQDNDFTKSLSVIAKKLPKPKAILCVSAHWVSEGTYVTGSAKPEQIYDFYGFPEELYKVKYRPEGSLALAKETAKLLKDYAAAPDTEWGIDHGTWSILKHMYPKCDVPVIQLSLNASMTEKDLSMIDWAQFAEKTPAWAKDFDSFVKNAIDSANDSLLINYAENNPNAAYAVATNEHYLPMLYACALRGKGEKLEYFYEGFQHASISMRSFAIGV
jgi:4,5-DOPA dioxygenase extradiol